MFLIIYLHWFVGGAIWAIPSKNPTNMKMAPLSHIYHF